MSKGRGFNSIKEGGGIQRGKASVPKSANLGNLLRKYRDLEDVLYPYVTASDMVYEEMDFTIEEFSDMTGADIVELMAEINKVVHAH